MVTYNSIAVGTGDPAVWNSGTSYNIGDRVRVNSQKKIYENIVAGINVTSPENAPDRWTEVGTMNCYAMFDTLRSSVSTATDIIELAITPTTRVNSLALLGMINVEEILISVFDSFSNTLYSTSITAGIESGTYIDLNIPPAHNASIEIVLNGTGSIGVGTVVLGNAEYLGEMQSDVLIDTSNFSNIDRDTFGYTSMVAKRSVPKLNCTTFIKSGYIPRVFYIRSLLNAIPAVWVAMETKYIEEYYEPLVIFGFYKQFSINLESPIHSTITLELEEM